jgi:Cys-rich protein (TIGR01571 family)
MLLTSTNRGHCCVLVVDSNDVNEVPGGRKMSTLPVIPSYQVLAIGDFQYDLCSCADRRTRCRLLWWNAFCLQCIPMAQLINRFRWNVYGSRTNFNRSITFSVTVVFYFLAIIGTILFTITSFTCDDDHDAYRYYDSDMPNFPCFIPKLWLIIMMSISFVVSFIVLILIVRVRYQFRQHYNIEGNCFADCCTMWCCPCCANIQMLRQTHDEDEYPYTCCKCLTGLPDNAPEIV